MQDTKVVKTEIGMASNYKILILGGGTAGWMAANLFAKNCAGTMVNGRRIEINVVESAEIGIVGVGEGSTPQLKALFDHLEIAESDWMPKCNATYKNGISFKGWSGKRALKNIFIRFQPRPIVIPRKRLFTIATFVDTILMLRCSRINFSCRPI
jgi:2-polyprenyl-6-methoxyphenol hydroxylase-like FAD-dependent oxidoreductase